MGRERRREMRRYLLVLKGREPTVSQPMAPCLLINIPPWPPQSLSLLPTHKRLSTPVYNWTTVLPLLTTPTLSWVPPPRGPPWWTLRPWFTVSVHVPLCYRPPSSGTRYMTWSQINSYDPHPMILSTLPLPVTYL